MKIKYIGGKDIFEVTCSNPSNPKNTHVYAMSKSGIIALQEKLAQLLLEQQAFNANLEKAKKLTLGEVNGLPFNERQEIINRLSKDLKDDEARAYRM